MEDNHLLVRIDFDFASSHDVLYLERKSLPVAGLIALFVCWNIFLRFSILSLVDRVTLKPQCSSSKTRLCIFIVIYDIREQPLGNLYQSARIPVSSKTIPPKTIVAPRRPP